MDAQMVMTAISTLGFPIVMCIIMAKYVSDTNKEHREEIERLNAQHTDETAKLSEAINNNTLALQKLVDKLDIN